MKFGTSGIGGCDQPLILNSLQGSVQRPYEHWMWVELRRFTPGRLGANFKGKTRRDKEEEGF
jgi:hypothetical protein